MVSNGQGDTPYEPPAQYLCSVCRKPISMDFMSRKMMEFMEMPVDGGAHEACLRGSGVQNPTHNRGKPNNKVKPNKKGK